MPRACVPPCREPPDRRPSVCATLPSSSPRPKSREHPRNRTLTRDAHSHLPALQLTHLRFTRRTASLRPPPRSGLVQRELVDKLVDTCGRFANRQDVTKG